MRPLSLREAMNRLFNQSIWDPFETSDLSWSSWRESIGFPKIDIAEDRKSVTITADVPGIDPDDIEIEVDEMNLIIRGETNREEKEEGKEFYHLERESGSFHRSIPLPARVKTEKAEAQIKNGVLKVILLKSEENGRQKIKIKR